MPPKNQLTGNMLTFLFRHRRSIAASIQLAVFLLPAFVFAATNTLPKPITKVGDVEEIICDVANFLFGLAIVLSVIFVLYAAFLYLTSGGDEKKVSEAKSTLTYAAVGVAVALLAGGMPQLIGGLFGEDISSQCGSGSGGSDSGGGGSGGEWPYPGEGLPPR